MPRLDLLRTLAFMNLTNTKKTKWMERKTPIRRVCLVLIISVFASLPMFILSFCEVSRGILKKLNTIGQDSSGRMTGIKRNIGWSNGTLSANQKNKED